ncbi:MAG: hypothetical protein ACYDAD_14435, partial [Acidimicrobiales bacterium]
EFTDPQFVARVNELEDLADQEADAGLGESGISITFRWGRPQLAILKRAAAMIGVPYQTYLKQVVYKQAIEDIQQTKLSQSTLTHARRGTQQRDPALQTATI